MTFLLALALMTLALTGTGPTMTSSVVVWTRPLNIGPGGANSISVGPKGVYVGGGDELRRYDFDGNIVWTRQIGATPPVTPPAYVSGVAVGPRGVHVVGGEGRDAFVALYSFEGAMIWTRHFETGPFASATSVSADSGAVYVGGIAQVSKGNGYAFVTKFDSNGDELWSQRIQSRILTAISVGPRGVYVTESYDGFYPTQGSFKDTFFTAFDLDGHTLWTKQLNNETLLIECGGPATLSVGSTGIYVADNTCLRAPSTGVVYVSFIRKYDFGGNELWTRWSRTVGGASGVWNQNPRNIGRF